MSKKAQQRRKRNAEKRASREAAGMPFGSTSSLSASQGGGLPSSQSVSSSNGDLQSMVQSVMANVKGTGKGAVNGGKGNNISMNYNMNMSAQPQAESAEFWSINTPTPAGQRNTPTPFRETPPPGAHNGQQNGNRSNGQQVLSRRPSHGGRSDAASQFSIPQYGNPYSQLGLYASSSATSHTGGPNSASKSNAQDLRAQEQATTQLRAQAR